LKLKSTDRLDSTPRPDPRSRTLVFATRPSALARRQTAAVIALLQSAWPGLDCRSEIILTAGDRNAEQPLPEIGGKGVFTAELEAALLAGAVDAAVHSLKDLPVEGAGGDVPGITLAAVPARGPARDVLVSAGNAPLEALPRAARVGTCSVRRTAQLLARRPDLTILPLRGNVDTRLRRLEAGEYDAIVLAAAGLVRLGLESRISETFPLEWMLPAPGQGALAVQCRSEDSQTIELLAAIHDESTHAAVSAERAFLAGLGGGCSLPVGAYAERPQARTILTGGVTSPDGQRAVRLTAAGEQPRELGERLAELLLERGAGELLGHESAR
jgi:hydroxymethylbilane synthase